MVITHANDLQRLAQRHGWEVGPLTYARVSRMGSQELNFHEVFNKAELQKALDAPRVEAENKRNEEDTRTAEYWKGGRATPETVEQVQQFISRYPQFRADLMSNRTALIDDLKASNLPVTQENLRNSFESLARDGRLTLSPSKVGVIRIRFSNGRMQDIRREDLSVYQRRDPQAQEVQEDDGISGARLSRCEMLDVLLSPHTAEIQEKREQGATSADEFRRGHKELHETRVPPLIAARMRQHVATVAEKHPEVVQNGSNAEKIATYLAEKGLPVNLANLDLAHAELSKVGALETNNAVATVPGTKLIDYDGNGGATVKRGTDLPTKESLAYKVNSMSAAEYATWLQNPANRRAVDNAAAAR